MKKRNQSDGLTLIELLVAMAAASILILTVALMLIMAFRSWRINNAFVDLRRDSAMAFYMMTRDVREADDDTRPVASNPLILPSGVPDKPTVTYYTTSDDALVYKIGSDEPMTLIPDGVQFIPTEKSAGDGVSLKLILTGDFGIAITNEVFVNTRN